MRKIYPFRHSRRVYCAGPLFNQAERSEMEQIAAVLTADGFEPFVPHSDGMEFSKVQPWLISEGIDPTVVGQTLHSAIFAMDVYQVVAGCGSLVFNMNGRVPDEGAVAEATMAWMLGKPVVIFKEDVRSKIAGRDNPLLVGQARFQSIARLEDLPAALRARLAECSDENQTVACPPHLGEVVENGRLLCERLDALNGDRSPERVAPLVWELFGPCAAATA